MRDQEDDRQAMQRAIELFESRRRSVPEPRTAGELLSRLIARTGFTQDLFNEELQAAWQKVAGQSFARRSRPTRIRRGTLEVLVESSPALQQIGFEKERLLTGIRQELPSAGIRALQFRIGAVSGDAPSGPPPTV